MTLDEEFELNEILAQIVDRLLQSIDPLTEAALILEGIAHVNDIEAARGKMIRAFDDAKIDAVGCAIIATSLNNRAPFTVSFGNRLIADPRQAGVGLSQAAVLTRIKGKHPHQTLRPFLRGDLIVEPLDLE